MVMPSGPLNFAAVPVPSVWPDAVWPANVVTTPAGVILRIMLLPSSATYTLPAGSNATSPGVLNNPALPVPFVEPLIEPAGSEVVPERPATTFEGAFGTKPGVTFTVAAGPTPAVFVAVTLTVYAVLFVKPEIVHVIVGGVAVHD